MPRAPLPFGVIILGAGASTRMGRPKLLLPWRGTTVIGHIIGQWRDLGALQTAIVQRANDNSLTVELDRLHVPQSDRIKNPDPERGMFSSILCAADWTGWKPEITSFAIALGDQPQLRMETLRGLMAFHGTQPNALCQPEFQGRPRHPVLLPRDIFNELKLTRAETLKDFLKLIPGPAVQYSVDDAALSLDLDTPEDYIRAMTQFGA
ncbi:MAG TPA: nucleotidyltransferase family protein [Candidatus Acidoferrales bacterium]|nr:nucleotidyltransferase family protein [Candidatus Acidoferrales bacterium]